MRVGRNWLCSLGFKAVSIHPAAVALESSESWPGRHLWNTVGDFKVVALRPFIAAKRWKKNKLPSSYLLTKEVG